ncbi:HAD family hydrolase [Acinetobacter sp. ANC 3791]|uniref:HAD family hydrolase n=1 Tax=Acinetobacter sp. ANC 3791 TaxID=2529836 RepID=UPI00103DF005|nr:HAD family hydrolase [Acinetobacter sp. ANC 3791]TCB82032.1 haloacid dehalogenase-like hydrolase [Acinetobacter sp. ANC 3791]
MHASRQTSERILIERGKTLALFDFDGTLCLSDSFTQFIFYTLSKRHIIRQGIKILPWIQGYYLNLYPAHAMRTKLYNQMFSQQNLQEIESLASEYSRELLDHLNPVILAQLKQHQDLGHEVAIVSASLDLYLQPIAQYLNVRLICTETEKQQNILTGQYASPDCSGEQKKLRILDSYNLENYDQIYAYGNSHEDKQMLSLAHYPFMVGKDRLLPSIPCKSH